MGLSVTFVSGPRRSGKSAVIRTMIDRLWKQEPHYIRLAKTGGDKQPPKPRNKPPPNFGVATARWPEYEADHVFDVLPVSPAIIHRRDRFVSVGLEAGADPGSRNDLPDVAASDGAPIGSEPPAASALPSTPPISEATCVERDPRTRGVFIPPATAR